MHRSKAILLVSGLCLIFVLLSVTTGRGATEAQVQNTQARAGQLPVLTATAPAYPDLPDVQIDSDDRSATQPGIANLSTGLNELHDAQSNPQLRSTDSFTTTLLLDIVDGRVKVMLTMQDEAATDAIIQTIPQLGGEVIARYKQWIDAWIPIDQLENLAKQPGVNLIQEAIPVKPPEPVPPRQISQREHTVYLPFVAFGSEQQLASPASSLQSGTYLSQGVAATNADDWHVAGLNGQGVKIAILDSFQNYQQAQAAGELPTSLVISGVLDLDSPHGTACAEIIYDMAPGATLRSSPIFEQWWQGTRVRAKPRGSHTVNAPHWW